MKKMMFLTLALSVMAMGSAMANDSIEARDRKPNKVKIEINHNCCGDHGDWRYDCRNLNKHNHNKKGKKLVKGPKCHCPVCEYRASHDRKGPRPNFNGKRPGGYHPAYNGGYDGRPGNRR